MKKLLLLTLFLQSLIVHGQFNRTFSHTINNNNEFVAPTDIIDGSSNTTVTIGHNWNNNYLVLRKLDFNGNVLLERVYERRDYIPTRLIKTPNNGYIAVGQIGRSHLIFAIKFDNSFNIIWSAVYGDGTGYPVNFYPGITEMVNIIKVNNSADDYIIVGAGGAVVPPASNPGSYAFTAISALRISGTAGTVLWNMRYHSPLMASAYYPATPGLMFMRRENPTALAYGSNKYFIGGVALSRYYTSGGIMGPYDDKFTNFVMTIDENGLIVNPYKEFTVPGVPKAPSSYSFHDALFDMQTQQFVMSFTINGFLLANGVNKTEIGIVKFSTSLGFSNFRYYFDSNKPDHFAYRIKETYAHDGYILACGVNNSLPTSQAFVPALLKVDKAGDVDFYHRYNQNKFFHQNNSFLANPVLTPIMNGSGIENYAMACSPVNTRVISTNTSGLACGMTINYPEYIQSDLSLYPTVSYDSTSNIYPTSQPTYPNPVMTVQMTDCINDPNPDNYKITDNTATIEELAETVQIAPNPSTGIVRVTLPAAWQHTEIQLHNSIGQIVNTWTTEESSKTLDISELPAGIYIMNLTNQNKQKVVKRIAKQ